MRGNGDGTFQSARVIDVGSGTVSIGVGDFNRDGFSDLVLASSSSRVHVLLGRGDGTFAQQTLILIGNGDGSFRDSHFIQEPSIGIPHYQAVADYNGDGRLDLALSLGWGSQGLMEIRNGNGDGTFGPLVLYLVPPDKSSISVSVGNTGSAAFSVGTSITLSVTNGRDAIWSGACSSGGDKRRTCTFTLNGNAAVTANVQ